MKGSIWKLGVMMGCLLLIMTGCGQPDKPNSNESSPKISSEAGKKIAPISKGEYGEWEKKFLRFPGQFSGSKFNEKQVKAAIGKAPSNASNSEYVDYIMSLVAEDYRPVIQKFNQLSTNIETNNSDVDGSIKLPENKKVHFSILLDASGSMNKQIDGKTKMEIAKGAVKKFASSLPVNAVVSLRVYGHKGTSSEADKQKSCKSTEEVYHSEGYQEGKFSATLGKINPSGWTPIAEAIKSTSDDINEEATDSYIYIVSDGEETCGGDPVKAAENLKNAKSNAVVNIIGFDVDDQGQQSLKKVAQAGGGEFYAVDNEDALNKYVEDQYDKLRAEWRKWIAAGKDQAEDQSDKLHDQARNIEKEMDDLERKEFEHIKQVTEWLKEKGNSKAIQEALKALEQRREEIKNYANERSQDIYSQAWKSKVDEKEDVIDKGNKEVQDLE